MVLVVPRAAVLSASSVRATAALSRVARNCTRRSNWISEALSSM